MRQVNKDEERAAKHRPPGTRLLDEADRVSTLEALHKNKQEVTKLLMQLPISMRTENLKRQKVELEHKLLEIDKS